MELESVERKYQAKLWIGRSQVNIYFFKVINQ